MRIAILTFHYVYNEGAIWQAVALCSALRRRFCAHTFEIVDYRPRGMYESLRAGRTPALVSLYESVLAGYLGRERIVDDGTQRLFAALDGEYDAVIVGSDIVWQFPRRTGLPSRVRRAIEQRGPMRPSCRSPYAFLRDVKNYTLHAWRDATRPDPRALPFPNAYWLPGGASRARGSFAVSIGYSDWHGLRPGPRREMREHVAAFDFISVRDRATLEFVRFLDPGLADRTVLTPDPAWLYDDPLPPADDALGPLGLPADARLAGVLFPRSGSHGRRLERWLLPELRRRGYRVVSVIDSLPAADYDCGSMTLPPFAWWRLVERLDFLVTVRTHPNIAALKYETPFLNVDITAMLNRAAHSKSRDMLAGFGLPELCIYRREHFSRGEITRRLDDALSRDWDWPAIRAQREQCRLSCESVMTRLAEAIGVT